MLSRFKSLIFAISFFISFAGDAGGLALKSESALLKSVIKVGPVSGFQAEHKECHDDDCHDHSDHCIHHCSGLHYFVELSSSVKELSRELVNKDGKLVCYFNLHYEEPFLDPALKPPLYS